MCFQIFMYKITKMAMTIFLLSAIILLPCFTGLALSKSERDQERSDFYGIIQERPKEGLHGEWKIGNRIFLTDQATEFDETEGPLKVGHCAKVHIREGRIHEIDSEPMHDCQ